MLAGAACPAVPRTAGQAPCTHGSQVRQLLPQDRTAGASSDARRIVAEIEHVRAAADSPIRAARPRHARRARTPPIAPPDPRASPRAKRASRSPAARPAAGRSCRAADPGRTAPPGPAPPRRARPAGRAAPRRSTRTAACRPGRRRARGSGGRCPPRRRAPAAATPQNEWIVLIRAESRSRTRSEPIVGLLLGDIRSKPLAAGLADAVAHFAGGPLGEGDGHQLAQPRRRRRRRRSGSRFGQEPLGEHERLAAAGPGRERTETPRASIGPLLIGQRQSLSLVVGCHVFSKERT